MGCFVIKTSLKKSVVYTKMPPKRCPKTGKFLPKKKGKSQGGMFASDAFLRVGDAMRNHAGAATRPATFAPDTFVNLGQAMMHPGGAANRPVAIFESDSDSSDDELARIQQMIMRLPPPSAGGVKKKRRALIRR